ncbi:MAG: S8 family serine peptidase [Desulfotomaculaceae bacterium]|nr:S8 family serine peptidase [Desulfotomaculaceae bacterium]
MRKYMLLIILSLVLILPSAAYSQDLQRIDELKKLEMEIQAQRSDSLIVKYKDESLLGKKFKSSILSNITNRTNISSDLELITAGDPHKLDIIMSELKNDPDVEIVESNTLCRLSDNVNNQSSGIAAVEESAEITKFSPDNDIKIYNNILSNIFNAEQGDSLKSPQNYNTLPLVSKSQASSSTIIETEPNNNKQYADNISINSTVCGTITDVYYDLDYYRINIDQSGDLIIVGMMGNYTNYSKYLGIALCDVNDNVIAASTLLQSDSGEFQGLLKHVTPGTYYIVILQTSSYKYLLVDETYCYLTSLSGTNAPVTSVNLDCNKLKMLKGASEVLSFSINPSEATNQAVNWSSGNSTIASVDTNGKITAKNTGTTTIAITTQDGGKKDQCQLEVVNSFPVNDPGFGRQWGLDAINVPDAWNYIGTAQQKPAVVAVIDTGIDTSHEDLTNRIAPNGYNFILDNHDIYDINGHGSMVSGTIAAQTNNNKGIAGVTGNMNVKILPLQAGSYDGLMYISDEIRAIDYAVEQGVDVISISFGGTNNSVICQQSIQNAIANGIVVVASAGNGSDSYYEYPASYANVISVGSISEDGNISDFSQHNDKVDFVAPGNNIYTTNYDNEYKFADGTSFSAPMVSGVVAMMKAANPALTPEEINHVLISTAKDKGAAGKDNYYGYGLIDSFEAIKAVSDITAPAYQSAAVDGTNKVVTLTFSENLAANTADLKGAVTVSTNGTTFTALGTGDTVAISGNTLVVTFNTALTGSNNKIRVAANSLKDGAGNILTAAFTTDMIMIAAKFGDMNEDNDVNILDLLWMSSKIGSAGIGDALKADVNNDGQVNILDLLMVAQNIDE